MGRKLSKRAKVSGQSTFIVRDICSAKYIQGVHALANRFYSNFVRKASVERL